MEKIESKHKETLRNLNYIVYDLSDTAIKGNAAYGAFFLIPERLKRGKITDAISLGLNGLRLYVMSHLKPPHDGWERENVVLSELYQVLDEHNITKNEMERVAEKYINFGGGLFQRRGLKESMDRLRNFGKPKEIILLTKESSESAEAAKRIFGFDRAISNVTKYHSDDTINGVEYRMKAPEDRPNVLKEELGENLERVGVISNNESDKRAFEGKVGLFIPFGRNKKGKIHISDFEKFVEQLDSD